MLYHIFIVSDGTGLTAEQALKAALVQFEETEVRMYMRPNVRTKQQVLHIISEAHNIKGMIVHTIVSKKLRDLILEQGRLHNLDTIDLMGPLLAQLSHNFADSPSEKPGVFHELNKAYFQRIKAIEFTFRHDDGLRIEELEKAEIVLLGVSRTFKTPISVYLAYKGWFVANIPIILGIEVPDIIYKLQPKRVFCLMTFPDRLAELRKVRERHLGGATGEYAKLSYVKTELNYANKIYKKQPKWFKIDVTNKPIEEISSEILTVFRNNRKKN